MKVDKEGNQSQTKNSISLYLTLFPQDNRNPRGNTALKKKKTSVISAQVDGRKLTLGTSSRCERVTKQDTPYS